MWLEGGTQYSGEDSLTVEQRGQRGHEVCACVCLSVCVCLSDCVCVCVCVCARMYDGNITSPPGLSRLINNESQRVCVWNADVQLPAPPASSEGPVYMCVSVCICVCGGGGGVGGVAGHRGKCVGWLFSCGRELARNSTWNPPGLFVKHPPHLISERKGRIFVAQKFFTSLLLSLPRWCQRRPQPQALVCSQHRGEEEEGGCGRGAGEDLKSIHYISIDSPLFFTALFIGNSVCVCVCVWVFLCLSSLKFNRW